MEYKVSYDKKEYNLNAVLSFDLLKEILYKLLISQDNLEKEVDNLKKSKLKTDNDILKLEQIIKESLAYNEENSQENAEFNITEKEPEITEYKEDKNEEEIENISQKENESKEKEEEKEEEEEKEDDEKEEKIEKTEEKIEKSEKSEKKEEKSEKEKSYIINEIKNDNNKVIKQDKNNLKGEQLQLDSGNEKINVTTKEENKTNTDNSINSNKKENIIKDNEAKDNNNEKTVNIEKVEKDIKDANKEEGKDKKKVSETTKKEESKKEEANYIKIKTDKHKNYNVRKPVNMEIAGQSQVPLDLVKNMAKQIKDNKKSILDKSNNLKKEMRTHLDSIKKDYQKSIKEHTIDNISEFKSINEKIDEIFKFKEELESKMEDCISKCSTIDIYNMFKDSGDGTIDAAKVLVRALEEKVFKKIEFVDTRYKKDAMDNMKIKNNVENLLPNVENINRNIEKINEILDKNNEEINNFKKDFDDQKNEIKNFDESKNDLENKLNTFKNDIEDSIKNRIDDLEKKIEEIKTKNEGANELFKLGFGNKSYDDEVIQSLEKKINDLRKKTNDLENTLKLKNQGIEEMQNETKNIKLILDKKIAREDLKELYNMHLSDVDEINDLKDNAGMTFDELRKTKNEITNILQKIDSINGNIVLLQNDNKPTGRRASISSMINFDKYIDQQKLTETLKPLLKEIEKMYREIESLNRNTSEYESNLKNYVKQDRVNRLEDEINTKISELKNNFTKKFTDKVEFLKTIKQLEIQIKSLDSDNKKGDADSWLMAKQPVGCFNCASCEANIKNVNPSSEYLAWNKYPHQDKIYRMGQGFSHMLQMMTSEFVKSVGNAEKENDNEITSRSNNINLNLNILEKNQLNSDNNERKQSASVLKITGNKEKFAEDLLKKINNFNLNTSKNKGKVQLPRVLKFKKKLKLKNEEINNIPVSDDEYNGKNDYLEKEGFKENTSPKILKILKKKPFVKTEENLNFTQGNNSKI